MRLWSINRRMPSAIRTYTKHSNCIPTTWLKNEMSICVALISQKFHNWKNFAHRYLPYHCACKTEEGFYRNIAQTGPQGIIQSFIQRQLSRAQAHPFTPETKNWRTKNPSPNRHTHKNKVITGVSPSEILHQWGQQLRQLLLQIKLKWQASSDSSFGIALPADTEDGQLNNEKMVKYFWKRASVHASVQSVLKQITPRNTQK